MRRLISEFGVVVKAAKREAYICVMGKTYMSTHLFESLIGVFYYTTVIVCMYMSVSLSRVHLSFC